LFFHSIGPSSSEPCACSRYAFAGFHGTTGRCIDLKAPDRQSGGCDVGILLRWTVVGHKPMAIGMLREGELVIAEVRAKAWIVANCVERQ